MDRELKKRLRADDSRPTRLPDERSVTQDRLGQFSLTGGTSHPVSAARPLFKGRLRSQGLESTWGDPTVDRIVRGNKGERIVPLSVFLSLLSPSPLSLSFLSPSPLSLSLSLLSSLPPLSLLPPPLPPPLSPSLHPLSLETTR